MTIISSYSPVLNLQFLLELGGQDPGPLDGVVGPRTVAALTAFQVARDLPPCKPNQALSDNRTRPALLGVARAPGAKAILEGMKYLGVHEDPPGTNQTLFGTWFGVNGVPWCNIFVSYCFVEGSGLEICAGYHGSGTKAGKGCAYVPTTENWLLARRLSVNPNSIQPGDIVIYAWDRKSPTHIGMCCTRPDPTKTFQSLEGNTSLASDSNGGEVLLRPRNLSFVTAAGRLT